MRKGRDGHWYTDIRDVYDCGHDDEHQATIDYINSTRFTNPQGSPEKQHFNLAKDTYYNIGGIEVIDFIKAKLSKEQYRGYLLGNIYKYSGRMQYKGEYQKDVKKLVEYTQWLEELDANNS